MAHHWIWWIRDFTDSGIRVIDPRLWIPTHEFQTQASKWRTAFRISGVKVGRPLVVIESIYWYWKSFVSPVINIRDSRTNYLISIVELASIIQSVMSIDIEYNTQRQFHWSNSTKSWNRVIQIDRVPSGCVTETSINWWLFLFNIAGLID